jgi:hypothetical protein
LPSVTHPSLDISTIFVGASDDSVMTFATLKKAALMLVFCSIGSIACIFVAIPLTVSGVIWVSGTSTLA